MKKDTLEGWKHRLMAAASITYPPESLWTHKKLEGFVKVIKVTFSHNSPDPKALLTAHDHGAGFGIEVEDQSGKVWSCYSPHVDLLCYHLREWDYSNNNCSCRLADCCGDQLLNVLMCKLYRKLLKIRIYYVNGKLMMVN